MVAAMASRSGWPGTKALAVAALTLQGWVVIAIIGMHLLRPDLDPAQHRISEYAIGPYGALMASAYAASALAKLLLLLGLLRDGPMTWLAGWARVLLQFAILGVGVSWLFPTDAASGLSTARGALHDAGLVLNILSTVTAALLLTMSFNLDPRWRPVQALSLVLALALAVETFLLLRAMGAHEPLGFVNRAYAVTSIGWTSSTALRLSMIARS
jgi:hypothetical protein